MWRLLTRQIDTNQAQDDAVLREACTQARYGSDIEPARKAMAATPTRHANWLTDANFLAYGLARTGRDADAAPVFTSIGRYVTSVPWSWWGDRMRGDVAFVRARRRARRAA